MIVPVKSLIYQIRFKDKPDAICVYLYDSMISTSIDRLEVNFTIALELSLCDFNESIYQSPLKDTKEILVIQLSNNCPLAQQLEILKNISWIEDYFGIVFSGK